MQERKTILDYIYKVLAIFGFTMISMVFLAKIFGEGAKEISTLFSLGAKGVSLDTMIQFLIFSFINTLIEYIYFTDRIIKDLSMVLRTIFMVSTILLSSVAFIFLFGWFPVNRWNTWLAFFICFFICLLASGVLSYIKSKWENEKLAIGLKRLKEEGRFNEHYD